jgi:guanylate kinase
VDGVNYVFVSEAEFESRVERGLFLEHARVHGFRYGTLRGTVEDSMSRGDSVLLAIDVQGAAQVREGLVRAGNLLQESYLDVFIVPPSLEILRERLVRRGEDAAAVIDQRLRNAEAELRQQEHYRYVVVNDDLDRAYAEFCAILNRERSQAVR